jgi:integrase
MSDKERAPRPPRVSVKRRGGRYILDVAVSVGGERPRWRQAFEKRADAEAKANGIRVRLAAGLAPFEVPEERAPGFTHADALALYEAEHVMSEKVVPKSREKMIEQREFIERFALAKVEAEAAKLGDLLEYRKARKAEAAARKKGNRKVPKDQTIGKDLKHLRAALKHAKRRKRITVHVFEQLDPEDSKQILGRAWRSEDTVGRVVSPEEQESILAVLNPVARRMALFLAASGCRKGEAASLEWAAHYKHMPYPHFLPIVQKKSKARKIPFESIAVIVGPKQAAGLVFGELGETAEEIAEHFTGCWRYAEGKAGVEHVRPHDLRHTFGSEARRGNSLEDVAAVMGISAATARTYADHENDDLTRRIFEKRGKNVANSADQAATGSARN